MPTTFEDAPHMLRANLGIDSGFVRLAIGSFSAIHQQQGKQAPKNRQTSPEVDPTHSRISSNGHPKDPRKRYP
ncbi:hypothetical protein [Sphingobacterium sp.]|uniref:hypothetical protein n=1 Tax=Sphingobacterium sp. TaxID=341027 RepID=UPI0031CF896C